MLDSSKLEDAMERFFDSIASEKHPLIKCLFGYVVIIALFLIFSQDELGIRLANYTFPLTCFALGYYVWGSFDWILSKIVFLLPKFKESLGGWVSYDKHARAASDGTGGPPT